MNQKNKQTAMVSSAALALLALSGCGTTASVEVNTEKPVTKEPAPVKDAPAVVVTTTVPEVTPSPVTSTPSKSTYKDGTYTVIGAYTSPAGNEEIGVTVTLKNDIITEVSVEPRATAMKSIKLQKDFADNYKTLVIGKNISEVNLGKVSGASLTPKGFNDAITKIEAQAQVK